MNFYKWDDPSVRLTGRWSRLPEDTPKDTTRHPQPPTASATTTAMGSYLEFACRSREIVLHFDLGLQVHPYPHIYIQIDGGAKIESGIDKYVRIDAITEGRHVVKVIAKSAVEQLNRWYMPLMSAVNFLGYEAEASDVLEPDNRRIIEFIGDSITEGVLVESERKPFPIDQYNRPFQDDSQATYATLTAEALNLRPIYQAYGAVGLTRIGCASVPRACNLYPWCFDSVPYTGEKPDIVMINHGANDRAAGAEEYLMRYEEFLDCVIETNPQAIIICLSAFVGAYHDALKEFVEKYQKAHPQVHFISSKDWVPPQPLHPTRESHRVFAEHLIPLVKEII